MAMISFGQISNIGVSIFLCSCGLNSISKRNLQRNINHYIEFYTIYNFLIGCFDFVVNHGWGWGRVRILGRLGMGPSG